MSVLTSVGILVFSILIMAFLQLTPGIFMIFTHFTAGRFSKSKASEFATFFILGVETIVALIFLSMFFILSSSPVITLATHNNIFLWVMASILIALGIIFACSYFRKGKGTKLFISRRLASQYLHKAQTAKSHSDAFVLGVTSAIPELVFTLPLYILSTLSIIQIGTDSFTRAGLIILFALAIVFPLFVIHFSFSTHHTLADIVKSRFQQKSFLRFIITLSYFLIATLIILGAVL